LAAPPSSRGRRGGGEGGRPPDGEHDAAHGRRPREGIVEPHVLRRRADIATLPGHRIAEALPVLRGLYPDLQPTAGPMQTGLESMNLLVHPDWRSPMSVPSTGRRPRAAAFRSTRTATRATRVSSRRRSTRSAGPSAAPMACARRRCSSA
jgi:hypothetical protein